MRLKELSIIQYQNVSLTPEVYRLWLPLHAFKKQLEYFAANDFQLLSIDDALDTMEGKKSITGGRPISLTFDNGYQDFQEHVLPLLSQYAFPATLLISPLRVGTSVEIKAKNVPYLSWSALKELMDNRVTIGAYEDDGWNINKLPEESVREHITTYKKMLEDQLGTEIRYFGVKEGVPNRGIRDLLVSQGYRAFLTQCPTNRRPDLYSVGRIQVDDDDFNIFLTKVSQTYLFLKDKRSWRYIRKYRLDRVAHRLSETYDMLRGRRPG